MEPTVALSSVLVHVQQAICAMVGHDYLLRWNRGRVFLQCVDCGYEPPGWRIDAKIVHSIGHDEDSKVVHAREGTE